MYTLNILSLVLAVVSLLLMYFPRVPAAVVALAALVLPSLGQLPVAADESLVYWGIATLIVVGLRILQPRALTYAAPGNGYACTGALVGTAIGVALSPRIAVLILGACAGAVLGVVAWTRTPKGLKMAAGSQEFLSYMAAKGLPAVVTSVMACIALCVNLSYLTR